MAQKVIILAILLFIVSCLCYPISMLLGGDLEIQIGTISFHFNFNRGLVLCTDDSCRENPFNYPIPEE